MKPNIKIFDTLITLLLLAMALPAFSQTQEVCISAHRAGRKEFDENTLSAFEGCYKGGITRFETDIRMTKDGQLVIMHDSNFKKKFGIDAVLEEMTAAEVRKIKTKKGHDILFLDELMDWVDSHHKVSAISFEMKTKPAELYPDDRLAEYCDKLYERVMRNKKGDAKYTFSSSSVRALKYMKEKHPEARLHKITGQPVKGETMKLCEELGITTFSASLDKSTRAAVKAAHEKGFKVSLWPSTKPEDAVFGIYMGADYLCTDTPLATKKYLEENFPWLKVKM